MPAPLTYDALARALTEGPRALHLRRFLAVLATLPLAWGAIASPSTGLIDGQLAGLLAVGVLAVATPLWDRALFLYALVALAAFLVTGQTICLAYALFGATRARRLGLILPLVAVPLALAVVYPDALVVQGSKGTLTFTTTWVLLGFPIAVGIAVNVANEAALLRASRENERAALRESLLRERRMQRRERLVQAIHDGVGHQVSLMSVQSMTIGARKDVPDEVRAKCDLIQDAGADAMRALGDVLRVMRQNDEEHHPDLPGESGTAAEIDGLVATYRQYGQAITADVLVPDGLPPVVSTLLYRAAEEALSNTVRHAQGARVTVRLAALDDGVVLEVANTPPPAHAPSLPGTGHGQQQLARAVRGAGGVMSAGPTEDGGYLLRVSLPLR
ncbi:sensor histidine kinase [Streptomyces boninensis]|uniref:sensor histidine kinase n=1 Tax=Streptomyces boninensis TaxID=2039455 RepID=UPI003B224F19